MCDRGIPESSCLPTLRNCANREGVSISASDNRNQRSERRALRGERGHRCYYCKHELYTKLKPIASENDCAFIVDGSTTDDLGDYRPGRKASRESGIRSPLIEVNMNKNEVRALSCAAGLPTWDKPASPCLSSRIAYGTTVTIERLRTVDRGEEILR